MRGDAGKLNTPPRTGATPLLAAELPAAPPPSAGPSGGFPVPGPSLRPTLWVTGAFLSGVALHLDRLPRWITAVAVACALWALAAAAGRVRLPGRLLKTAAALVLTASVLMLFHTLNGLTAGTALLVLMGSIKLLESSGRRGRFIVIGVSLYLLLAASLASQQLVRAPLYLLQALICCIALIVAAHPQAARHTRATVTLAARSLLLTLPLALLLFLLFPRLSGSLWSLGSTQQAQTGLSDSMSPGSISELGTSQDPVFRVWFDGPPPPPQERYWRGPVLHDFDGYTWTRAHGAFFRPETLEYLGPAYRYRIRLEPDAGPWWLALDTIQSVQARRAFIAPDRQLIGTRDTHDAVTYTAVSYTHTRSSDTLSPLAQRLDTSLPGGRNPRSRALAQRLRAAAPDVPAFVDSVLNVFRRGGFEYTLTPPQLSLDSVDDFLFDTRRGFCGHFASAFVMLMRAGGVPARVVTGYQGGEWNPIGGYFLVRRSDAHAWAEVWEDGAGWVHVDPTAAVAPERLRRSLLDLLPNAGSAPERLLRGIHWLTSARQAWDAANAWWSTQVIAYNFSSQLKLLDRLGLGARGWQPLGWLLAFVLVGWMLLIGWGLGRVPRSSSSDRLARAYLKLCTKLARGGIAREPHQGPLAYAAALAADPASYPAPLRARMQALLGRYARLRFAQPPAHANEIADFERAVRALRISRLRSSQTKELRPQSRQD